MAFFPADSQGRTGAGRVASSVVLLCILYVLTAIGSAAAAPKEDRRALRIGILPFVNYSASDHAEQLVMPSIRKQLQMRGFAVAEEKAVDDFLAQERMRSTAYISSGQAKKIGELLNIDAVMLGAVIIYQDSKVPQCGLSARLVSTASGEIIWSGYRSATGQDFASLLGLGNITSVFKLVDVVAAGLFGGLSAGQDTGRDKEPAYRVAVMPFLNRGRNADAGIIVTNLFLPRLFQSARFTPIEAGAVRQTVVARNIRNKGEVSHGNMSALAEDVSADMVLVGAVEQYDEAGAAGGQPSVIITARLLDARTHRMLWAGDILRMGDDSLIVLDIGRLRTADRVAYAAVGDLIKKMEKTASR